METWTRAIYCYKHQMHTCRYNVNTAFCPPRQGQGMMTSEEIEVDETGRMKSCSPLDYKIPNIHSIPRVFNVTLMKNHDYKTVVYSSKVTIYTM